MVDAQSHILHCWQCDRMKMNAVAWQSGGRLLKVTYRQPGQSTRVPVIIVTNRFSDQMKSKQDTVKDP